MSPAEIHADAVAHFAALLRVERRLRARWMLAHDRGDATSCSLYRRAIKALQARRLVAAAEMRAAADALLAERGGRPLVP